ncbi:type II toxin-antitoxin system VapC family toxin [Dyadobacter frigoris]|uniref:Type II toxin-antitoxin system VapC family toxin n=1 Tax=Dyadobacter frigoris TaxID=2576211 RepID=A0A4U6D745_9BACT|nr:type II toxin-antitoxin system VapC family toxin [Dyadobacter frigoris]TKT91958.1 type II toxin-antitoxin system VapC family toxin [Dyadobacter frigoris]
MGQRFLMDSNVLIDFVAQTIPEKGFLYVQNIIDNEFLIPTVVKIEVLGFNGNFPELMSKMREFVSLATLLPLEDLVVDETINLRRNSKRIKLGDAIIAATALVHQLVLITRNTQDFKNIPGLSFINAHEL